MSDKVFQSYSFVMHWSFGLFTELSILLTFALTYAFSAFSLLKVSTLALKQLSAKSCFCFIVLLCTGIEIEGRDSFPSISMIQVKQRGHKTWWEHWLMFNLIWLIKSVWLNGWAFVYKLSGSELDPHCCHLNFRYCVCFEK